jgi:hypothetical protein
MEHEATTVVTAKAASVEKPKWTTVMVKNICQVVSRALADVPKQKEHKLNLRFMGFEAKKGKTKKELVKRLNTELL